MSRDDTPHIAASGVLHYAEVRCPNCGADDLIPVSVVPRLVTIPGEGKLGVKVAQKARDHRCGQTAITIVGDTGEIVGQLDLDGGQR